MACIVVRTYNEAIEFLEHFINYEKQKEHIVYNEHTFNLERLRHFLKKLDNPQDRFPSLHIAGTKGKGSTAAMLEAALGNAGYKVGLYTSPHIRSYCERMRIGGRAIPKRRFARYISLLKRHLEQSPEKPQVRYRTVFELLTSTAFLYFREEQADLAILEVGMGGRLDATNVVRPLVCVITSLGLDHTNLLGNTLRQIAWEKGGIIKQGIPLILAKQKKHTAREILPILKNLCKKRKSRLIRAEEIIRLLDHENVLQAKSARRQPGQRVGFRDADGTESRVFLPLLGAHQRENLRTVLTVLFHLKKSGFALDMSKAISGIGETEWRGRIELVPGIPPVILDGAHCPLSAGALREALSEYFPRHQRILLLGVLKGKNARGIARQLVKDTLIKQLITFTPPSPRGLDAKELTEMIRPLYPGVVSSASQEDAAHKALCKAGKNTLVVVAGSLYNISPMKKLFLKLR